MHGGKNGQKCLTLIDSRGKKITGYIMFKSSWGSVSKSIVTSCMVINPGQFRNVTELKNSNQHM